MTAMLIAVLHAVVTAMHGQLSKRAQHCQEWHERHPSGPNPCEKP
jgi:hypothetical protein